MEETIEETMKEMMQIDEEEKSDMAMQVPIDQEGEWIGMPVKTAGIHDRQFRLKYCPILGLEGDSGKIIGDG